MARNIAHLVLWLRFVFDLLVFLVEIDFRHLWKLFFGTRMEQDFYCPLSSEKLLIEIHYNHLYNRLYIQSSQLLGQLHAYEMIWKWTYSDGWGRSYWWRGWYPFYLSLWLHTLFNDRCQVWILISRSTYKNVRIKKVLYFL